MAIGKAQAALMIQVLLDHLPDNTSHENEDQWNACWNALSTDDRYEIGTIREEATQMIKDLLKDAENG